MEITSKFKDNINNTTSPLNSPSSHGSSSTSTTTTSNGPGSGSIPITRSDPNSPYPTTFVTADTSSFKQVVQMLTGSPKPQHQPQPQPDPNKQHSHSNSHSHSHSDPNNKHQFVIPPIRTNPKKPGFKLYERRNSLKHMMISPLIPNPNPNPNSNPNYSSFPPRNHSNHNYHHFNHINNNNVNYNHNYSNNNNNNNNNNNAPLSPSLLDFPSLTLSPVTPLIVDTFDKSSPSINGGNGSSSSEEDRAIAEKGFFLHPSPRDSNPQLLPLFPLSSPRISDP